MSRKDSVSPAGLITHLSSFVPNRCFWLSKKTLVSWLARWMAFTRAAPRTKRHFQKPLCRCGSPLLARLCEAAFAESNKPQSPRASIFVASEASWEEHLSPLNQQRLCWDYTDRCQQPQRKHGMHWHADQTSCQQSREGKKQSVKEMWALLPQIWRCLR